jgi:hypothetical protein
MTGRAATAAAVSVPPLSTANQLLLPHVLGPAASFLTAPLTATRRVLRRPLAAPADFSCAAVAAAGAQLFVARQLVVVVVVVVHQNLSGYCSNAGKGELVLWTLSRISITYLDPISTGTGTVGTKYKPNTIHPGINRFCLMLWSRIIFRRLRETILMRLYAILQHI